MDLKLSGDLAVVVGGARGLGQAIARQFLDEGARVVIIDRDQPADFIADVTDWPAIRALGGSVRERFGRCDHLVYAAAVGSGQFGFPFWRVDPASWSRVIEVNLVGASNVANAFAPAMAEAKTGTILFLASVAGQIGSQTDPPYSASKAGLINFAECAAKDLAPHGVRVNALCPGMVQTALNRSVFESWAARQAESESGSKSDLPTYEAWALEKIRALVPLGRWQSAEDIAAMAVFLASPRAANITGQMINVDGGYAMGRK